MIHSVRFVPIMPKILTCSFVCIWYEMKSSIVCDITPCSPLKINRRFGRTCPHLQGGRIRQATNQRESSWQAECFRAGFFLGLIFHAKYGDIFLRNVGWLSTHCMELYHFVTTDVRTSKPTEMKWIGGRVVPSPRADASFSSTQVIQDPCSAN
jgi:hypothetical protein